MVKTFKLTFACLFVAVAICPAAEAPTPEYMKNMKALQAQMGAIRKGVDVAKNATDMTETMMAVKTFWDSRNSEAANKAIGSVNAGAAAIKAAGDDKEATMAGMKMVGGGCKGCHDAHREKVSDTEFMIK